MGRPKRYCYVDGCGADAVGWSMCKKHYQRWKKWGDPRRVDTVRKATDSERFWSHVDRTTGDCWLWLGATKNGYGVFSVSVDGRSRMVQAHRFSYGEAHGVIPDGVTLDHLCHTDATAWCKSATECPHRRCVRPDHLAPMSLRENIQRGGNKAKTHCKYGHEFTADNIWWFTTQNGGRGRKCKTCGTARNRGRPLTPR
jgi:hypothetical protein